MTGVERRRKEKEGGHLWLVRDKDQAITWISRQSEYNQEVGFKGEASVTIETFSAHDLNEVRAIICCIPI